MRITKQLRHEATALFRSCQVDGVLDEARVRRTVREVIERKPRGYYALLGYFHRLVRLDLARRRGRVESAVSLAPDLRAGVEASLGRLYGTGLDLEFVTNAALVGGLRVHVGSDVYDGSVAGWLEQLRRNL